MTKRLEEAFAEASKLDEPAQDAVADWLLAELAFEKRWDRAFSRSRDDLAELADEAVAEQRLEDARDLDPG